MSLADELDELDPDFSHPHSHSFDEDDLDALGSSFGKPIHNSLERPSDEDEVDAAYEASLRALHSEFKAGDGIGSSLADLSSSSADSDHELSHWGLPHSSNGPPAPVTPQKHSRERSRNSLAFELASASKPTKGGARDLLRELGIDEEDEEEHGGRGDSSSDEDGQFAHFGGSLPPTTRGETPSLSKQISRMSLAPQASPPGTPNINRRVISRQKSEEGLFGQVDEEEESAREAEVERVLEQTAGEMRASLSLTAAFLRQLKNQTTPVALERTPSTRPSALASAASTNATTPRPASALAQEDAPADRQGVVEQLAGGVIKSVYELVRQREAMNRELAELERHLGRGGAGWAQALAMTDELDEPERFVDDGPLASAAVEKAPSESEDEEGFAQANGGPAPGQSPAMSSLSLLRGTTSSLLSTLSTLHESSQVSLAAGSDSGRKLRALRGQLQAAQEDLAASSRAERYVEEFERAEGLRTEGGRKGWRGEEARVLFGEVERGLEEGERRARKILAVA